MPSLDYTYENASKPRENRDETRDAPFRSREIRCRNEIRVASAGGVEYFLQEVALRSKLKRCRESQVGGYATKESNIQRQNSCLLCFLDGRRILERNAN